ncbi:hypothetical protein DDE82_007590 [Stemphylium lycopersici]|nr:hypothetical protein DDE82_007590 [Stemphylium lycopersici]
MPSKFSQPSPSAGDADDERSNASAETTECDEPTMLTTNIYTQAAKEQSTEVIAIKTTHREMCRERITREIETLQRIQALLAEAEYAELRIHFPILLDFDSKPTSSGPRWLSTIPVRGFSLEQMTGIVMKTAVPSSGNTLACEIRFLAMPEALILHIAQQLTLWDSSMDTVAANRNPAPPSKALGFADFRGRLGVEIDGRIVSIAEEDKMGGAGADWVGCREYGSGSG